MATTATGNVRVTVTGTLSKTIDLGSAVPSTQTVSINQALAAGTAANQVNLVYGDSGSLVASTGTITFDLSGSLANPLGDATVFTKVKVMAIKNTSTLGSSGIKITGVLPTGDSKTLTDGALILMPGDVFLLTRMGAGITVTNSSGDTVILTNLDGTNAQTYEILVEGLA